MFANDLQGLFQAGEDVEALLAHPGWTHVASLIDLEVRGLDEKLDGPLLATRSEYARLTGRRNGLRAMAEAARAIVSHAAAKREEQQRKHERAAGSALEA